jgi:anti-sigma regulatory factor (Ser/Thr protein kinase)
MASVEARLTEHRAMPPTLDSVRAGRRFLADVLTRWGLTDQLETATILTSEIVANAVVHAATPFVVDVSVNLDHGLLVVGVTDFDDRPLLYPITALRLDSLLDEPDLDAESGRGLMIVATLAEHWGVDYVPQGKRVWFALPLTGEASVPRPREHGSSAAS